MDSVDVLIVGGGPAGSTCAWALKKAGRDVLVLDAQDFPRLKLCAGWITPAVVKQLEIDPATYPHSFLTFPELACEYHRGAKARHFTLRSTQHSIRRVEFDDWLLRRSGARFERHAVAEIRRVEDGYVVDERYRCRTLVGAGGTRCPVRRALFADDAARSRDFQVAALEQEFHYPRRDAICRLWFAEDGLPGYAWVVPKGDGWLNVGLGAFSKHLDASGAGLRERWKRFTDKLERSGLVQGHSFEPRGATYYTRAPRLDVQRDGCLLIGDSAGLATRDLAEGIGPAVESGLAAARAITTGGRYELRDMTRYSYLPPGWVARLAERVLDRNGGFFRDWVFGPR